MIEKGVKIERACGCVYKRYSFYPADLLWRFCQEHRREYDQKWSSVLKTPGRNITLSTGENLMHFGDALEKLHSGLKVARRGWNGTGMWIALQIPNQQSFMTARYLYLKTADGARVPWSASQTDLLATDWEEVVE
jgi:Protein of unknown function (DUF2829)